MVCQACRNVETVDVGVGVCLETVDAGVGDDLILVEKVDVGVGDGFIDSAWLSTEVPREDNCVSSEYDGTKSEVRAAPVEKKENRNKSRKQCKLRKIIFKAPKNTVKATQSKPLKRKIKFKANERVKSTSLNKVTNSKSAATKTKPISPDKIVETGKSRFRLCKSKNYREKSVEVPSPESAPSTAKSTSSSRKLTPKPVKPGKSSSTPVKPSKSSSTLVKPSKSSSTPVKPSKSSSTPVKPSKSSSSPVKAGKRSSTRVKPGSNSRKRSSILDECGTTGEFSSNDSADDCSEWDKSESDVEGTAVPKVKQPGTPVCKQVECKICGRMYRTKYLKHHMNTHEEEDDKKRPYQCEKCGQRYANGTYRNNHQKICGNDSELLFQCPLCEKRLCNKYSLEFHIESHSNERSFQCHLCAKLFKSYNTLYTHIKSTHSELQPYACDQCEKRFKLKHSLISHKARHHEGKVATFKCEVCDKVFCFKNSLTAHLEQHKGIKKYMCEVCGKRFGRPSLWKIHLRIHNETKAFSCTECGKGFNQKYDLKRHMSTHTGIKPFKCEECGKQFIHRVYLVRHRCSGTEQSGEHRRKTRQRQTRNGDSNNEMLSNVEAIVECENVMASLEMYDLNMF